MAVNEEQNKNDIRPKDNKKQNDSYKSNDINIYFTVNGMGQGRMGLLQITICL